MWRACGQGIAVFVNLESLLRILKKIHLISIAVNLKSLIIAQKFSFNQFCDPKRNQCKSGSHEMIFFEQNAHSIKNSYNILVVLTANYFDSDQCPPKMNGTTFRLEYDEDYYEDYEYEPLESRGALSYEACCVHCLDDPNCDRFTFYSMAQNCKLFLSTWADKLSEPKCTSCLTGIFPQCKLLEIKNLFCFQFD